MVPLTNVAADGQLTSSQVKDVIFNEEITRRKDLGATCLEALVTKNRGRNVYLKSIKEYLLVELQN